MELFDLFRFVNSRLKMKTDEKTPTAVPKVKVAVLGTENVGKSGKLFF